MNDITKSPLKLSSCTIDNLDTYNKTVFMSIRLSVDGVLHIQTLTTPVH